MAELLDPTDPRILAIPVVECGEPLVDLREVPILRPHPRRPAAEPGPYLRATLVDRLITAQTLLPRGLHLLVVAGHRAAGGCVPPAHRTGGAVDLTLGPAAGPGANPLPPVPGLSGAPARALEPPAPPDVAHLARALSAAGLAGLPGSWWHWSYGDAYWSYRTGAAAARYSPLP